MSPPAPLLVACAQTWGVSRLAATLYVLTLLLSPLARAGTDVLTNNYDASRSGANLSERTLRVANVRPESFGKLFHYSVDGPVLGQPLVVSDLDMPGRGRRDIVFVTTGSNSVYAFDATGRDTAPLWHRSLTRLPGGQPAAPTGIQSTPVIDKTSQSSM
jgi:hypothetical protein